MASLNPLEIVNNAYSAGLELEPDLSIAEWSDKHRILPSKASSEAGRWRTNRTPYLREILDCLSPRSSVERVVFMKGSQLGGTEAGTNWVSYIISKAPGPLMVVMPTVELAKRWSVQRLTPTILEMEVLSDKVADPRSRDSGNTQLVKEFQGGVLIVTGANSAVGLRSMPTRYLFLDEIDAYPADADGEGDPVALAMKRTATFSRKKILMISTPTIKGISRIEREYTNYSDARKYYVPCPECSGEQYLKWKNLLWDKDEKGNHLPETAYYECEHCKYKIEEFHKTEMLEKGKWKAENPDTSGKVAGSHLNCLYSPIGWKSWPECVEEFIEAKQDKFLLKTWTNTILGECWEEQGEGVEYEYPYARREDYSSDPLPDKVLLLTCGVDTQDDRICYEVVGWCQGEESYSIEYNELSGDPGNYQVWKKLDEILNSEYNHPSGVKMKIACTFIDSGGHHTDSVYRFCSERQFARVYACKGSNQAGRPILSKPSKTARTKSLLYLIGTDTCKELIYSRLKLGEPVNGYMHFPFTYDKEYFLMLTAEKVITKFSKGFPKREWVNTRRRNEALDCRVYAYSAFLCLNPNLDILENNLKSDKPEKVVRKPTANYADGWITSVKRMRNYGKYFR